MIGLKTLHVSRGHAMHTIPRGVGGRIDEKKQYILTYGNRIMVKLFAKHILVEDVDK